MVIKPSVSLPLPELRFKKGDRVYGYRNSYAEDLVFSFTINKIGNTCYFESRMIYSTHYNTFATLDELELHICADIYSKAIERVGKIKNRIECLKLEREIRKAVKE